MTGGHNKDPKNQVYPISIGLTSSVCRGLGTTTRGIPNGWVLRGRRWLNYGVFMVLGLLLPYWYGLLQYNYNCNYNSYGFKVWSIPIIGKKTKNIKKQDLRLAFTVNEPTSWTYSCQNIHAFKYPLVNIQKLWKITIFNGKTHYKLPFPIAMLKYQRVYQNTDHCKTTDDRFQPISGPGGWWILPDLGQSETRLPEEKRSALSILYSYGYGYIVIVIV